MRRLWLLVGLALSGCPAPGPESDGGTLDAGVPTILDGCLNPPALPEAPRLSDWICPANWESVATHAITEIERASGYAEPTRACAPPALPASCPAGQRPVLGSSACATVGDACPAGDFPPAPSGTVFYVKAGATGGNGWSASSPLGSIAQAVSMAAAGATIVIAKGSYAESVPLIRPVTLLGACAEQTIITAPSASATRGTIDVGAAATIKNLQVGGPRPGIWVSFNTTPAVLQGVIVKGARLAGVFVSDNGRAELNDVLIQGTQVDPADNTMGRGLQVRTGGQVTGSGVVVEQNRDVGITLDGAGITLALQDLIVRDTQSETSSRTYGLGMEVRYGARATLTRALFEHNRNCAVVSDQPGSAVSLTDTVLQDTLPQENNNQYGEGLEGAAGVTIDLTRVLIRRMHAVGVRLGGTALTASDLAITDTDGRVNDRTQGLGLVMDLQAQATLNRAVFANNRIADILVSDRGSRVTLTDGRMYGVRGQASDGKWGLGFIAMSEAAFNATRLAIEHADDTAVQLQGKAVAVLEDLSVRDTGYGGPLTTGEGIEVHGASQATINRSLFSGNRRFAVGAFDAAVLLLSDLTVTDTAPDHMGFFGRGLVAQDGAVVSLTRGNITRARDAALYAYGLATHLTVDQTTVTDTQASEVSRELTGRALSVEFGASGTFSCLLAQGNRDVGANAFGPGTQLTLRRVRLIDTAGMTEFGDGVAVSERATLLLEDSEVDGNQNLGLAFANAQGVVRRTKIRGNNIGLYAGEGSVTREVAQADDAPAILEVQIEQSCSFEGNTTRVSGDFVPVPSAIDVAPKKTDY